MRIENVRTLVEDSFVSRWYRFWYSVGFKPWESDTATLAPQLRQLLTSVEAERQVPYGLALDLGCGTGRWSVELAQRGWGVVGVDVVEKAVRAARRRAHAAGVDASFFEGDVSALRRAGVEGQFSLFLDVECFNHLNDSQRWAMGREVDALASPEASLLLLAWVRARRGPLPPGANQDDLLTAFPQWRIVQEQPYQGVLPRPLRGVMPQWYRLIREPTAST